MRYDFVVVGSGIAGLSVSHMLAERGYKVALVGIPELTSIVASSSSGILTYHMPEPFISWAFETLKYYLRLEDSIIEVVDSLWFSRELMFMSSVVNKLLEEGVKAKYVSIDYAREFLGNIKLFDDENIVHIEGYRINIKRLIDTLITKIRELNVEVKSRWGNITMEGVRVGNDIIRGDIIVAAGPWSIDLVETQNIIVYRCQAVRLEEPRINVMVIDDTIGYYVNKAYDNTIALGDGIKLVVNRPEEALKPDDSITIEVLERARKRGLISKYKIAYIASAPCVGTGDSYPLVGRLREGLYILTAFDGVGFSIAPALASMLVDYIDKGSKLPLEADPLRKISSREPIEPID
ncbi:MAG: FAD-binding oxidoreductase [Acidilobaceae archaeon]